MWASCWLIWVVPSSSPAYFNTNYSQKGKHGAKCGKVIITRCSGPDHHLTPPQQQGERDPAHSFQEGSNAVVVVASKSPSVLLKLLIVSRPVKVTLGLGDQETGVPTTTNWRCFHHGAAHYFICTRWLRIHILLHIKHYIKSRCPLLAHYKTYSIDVCSVKCIDCMYMCTLCIQSVACGVYHNHILAGIRKSKVSRSIYWCPWFNIVLHHSKLNPLYVINTMSLIYGETCQWRYLQSWANKICNALVCSWNNSFNKWAGNLQTHPKERPVAV